jgi:hypothetical protein
MVAHWGWVPRADGGYDRGWVYYSAGSDAGGGGNGDGCLSCRRPKLTERERCQSLGFTCGNANQPVGGGQIGRATSFQGRQWL